MKIKIFCRCSLFPSWSGQGLISTPVLRYIPMHDPKNVKIGSIVTIGARVQVSSHIQV